MSTEKINTVENNFGDDLRRIRIERGLTLKQLGKILNVSHSYLGFVETGKRNAEGVYLSTLKNWMGNNEIILPASKTDLAKSGVKFSIPKSKFHDINNLIHIPVYDGSASGIGNDSGGAFNSHPHIDSYLSFTREYARVKFGTLTNLVCLEASGESMTPYIFPGDIMVIDTSDITMRKDGAAYILQISDTTVVKRLQRLSQSLIRITSDNPAGWAKDINISELETEGIQIAGRVVAVIKMA